MINFKLFNGLINLGGILTETYYRKSRATAEAKQELGLDPNGEYNASVGIASIEEFVTMYATNLQNGQVAVFDTTQFDQPLRADSLYVENANQDKIEIQIWRLDGVKIITQTFQRNKTPINFPSVPLPPNVVVVVKALANIDYLRMAFVPCMILDDKPATTMDERDLQNFIVNLSNDTRSLGNEEA